MAQKLGGQVFLDPDGDFARTVSMRGVPSWWVIDRKMKIVNKGSGIGVSGGSDDQNFEYYASKILQLEKY